MPRKKTFAVATAYPGSEYSTVVRAKVVSTESMNSATPYRWCFCKLCGRKTEYADALKLERVFRRIKHGAKEVAISAEMRANAQRRADELVATYAKALSGAIGMPAPRVLILEHCDIREMRGDFSVTTFRNQVERRTLLLEWATHGDMTALVRLPGPQQGARRPSKLYCDLHYSGRSEDARRAYQRDRRFVAEYEELIGEFWAQYAAHIQAWNLDDHALVRNAAYHHLRLMKAPTRALDEMLDHEDVALTSHESTSSVTSIEDYYEVARAAHKRIRHMKEPTDWWEELKSHGTFNQSKIAQYLGIERQAVSAALKRKANRLK